MNKLYKRNSIALAIALGFSMLAASASLHAQTSDRDDVYPSDRMDGAKLAAPVKRVSFNESVKQKVAEQKATKQNTVAQHAAVKVQSTSKATTDVKLRTNSNWVNVSPEQKAELKAKREAAVNANKEVVVKSEVLVNKPNEKISKSNEDESMLSDKRTLRSDYISPAVQGQKLVEKQNAVKARAAQPAYRNPAPMINNSGGEALPYENYKGIKNLDDAKMEWAKDNGLLMSTPQKAAPSAQPKKGVDVNAHRRLPANYDASIMNVPSSK